LRHGHRGSGVCSGKKDIEPFSKILRQGYKQRAHLFLYDPTKFAPVPVDEE
jgi:hypothetical protein